MDPISDVTGVTSSAATATPAASQLSTDEFFQIMISELTNQDPLEPLDNQQFLNQLVQTQTLQATTKLTESLESLLVGQQISSAGALIGKDIVGVDSDGNEVRGTVDRVVVSDGQNVMLGVGDELLPLSALKEVVASASE